MNQPLTTTMRRAVAACTLLAATATPALATVLTFDSQQPTVLLGGETLTEAGFTLTALEGPFTAANGIRSASGAILQPSDPSGCAGIACPVGDGSAWYAGLNDGGLRLSRGDGHAFSIDSLDYGFLAAQPVDAGLHGQLVLNGTRLGGGTLRLALDFPGQDADGNFVFASAALAPLAGTLFSSVEFSACIFTDGACVNSLEQSAFNAAQFALDNIGTTVSPVPEPSTWFSLLAGLGVLGAMRHHRRRRAVTPHSGE